MCFLFPFHCLKHPFHSFLLVRNPLGSSLYFAVQKSWWLKNTKNLSKINAIWTLSKGTWRSLKLEKQIISFFKLSIIYLSFFHKSQDNIYSSSFHIIFHLEESCFLHGGFDIWKTLGIVCVKAVLDTDYLIWKCCGILIWFISFEIFLTSFCSIKLLLFRLFLFLNKRHFIGRSDLAFISH